MVTKIRFSRGPHHTGLLDNTWGLMEQLKMCLSLVMPLLMFLWVLV
jgi:hypothetical protein